MRVTIYTPTKNRVDALAKAVDSVLSQTYPDIEHIVVSDGSTDGTEAYLKMRAGQDSRLKFFIKPVSEGAPAARNLAIKNSSGDFITGLDDDDEFLPERIQAFIEYWKLLEAFKIKPSCLYSQDIITRYGKKVSVSQKKGMVNADDLFEFNFIGNQVFCPKSHFVEAGLFDEKLPAWQDLEMYMRILRTFGTAHLLDMATQLYDETPKADRISVKAENRIRFAYSHMAGKHAAGSGRHSQQLMFQMFSKYYGVRPNIKDWLNFNAHGFWPKGLLKLALRTIRP